MKKLIRMKVVFLVVVTLMMLVQIASAATFDISVRNLPVPSGINSVTFWFNVSADFNVTSLDTDVNGNAIPIGGTLGWDSGVNHQDNIFKIDSYDQDAAFGLASAGDLADGVIFSFDYTGIILDLSLIEFGHDSTNLYGTEVFLESFDPASGAVFTGTNAVPIPGAVWLLGSGLLGLVAVRRRRTQG